MNNQIDPHLLRFSLLPHITPRRFAKIKRHFDSLEKAWQANRRELLAAGLKEKTADLILEKRPQITPERLKKERALLEKHQIHLLSQNSPEYPELLKELKDAPFALFCKGNLELLKQKQLAVVGTRAFTAYGKMVVEKIIPGLSGSGLVVTSGLAQGIDTIAHKLALKSQIPTIAVLGCGILEKARGQFDRSLMQEIVQSNGLIVSEYPPLFPASKYTFPARNRIISGLSLGTLVIEAGEKSGALITAQEALEENREVFAVPGSIFSPKSVGTHRLIAQGARPVTQAREILEAFHFALPSQAPNGNNPGQASLFNSSDPSTAPEKQFQFTDPLEKQIYQALSFDPLTIDQLNRKLAGKIKTDSAQISGRLSMLELQGAARNIGGGLFVRS